MLPRRIGKYVVWEGRRRSLGSWGQRTPLPETERVDPEIKERA